MQTSHFTLCLATIVAFDTACGPANDNGDPNGVTESRLDSENIAPARGYDLLTDTVSDFCLEPSTPSPISGVRGQLVRYSLDIIEDTKSLAKKMEVSAAASIKFGFVGGEGKMKFVSETELNQTSVYALATVHVENAPLIITNPSLKPDAADTLLFAPDRFRERCGDGYISAIVTGGEYFALIEITTSSEKERQELMVSAKASGLSFSVETSFKNAVSSMVSRKASHVRTLQVGGLGAQTTPCSDVECMLQRAKDMPSFVHEHPTMINAHVLSYRKLALPRDAMSPIDTQNALEVERDIIEAKFDTGDLRSRYRYALANAYQFNPFSLADVESEIETCNRNLNLLREAASRCYQNYKSCSFPTNLKPHITFPPTRSTRFDPCATLVQKCHQGDLLGGSHEDIFGLQVACVEHRGTPVDLKLCR